MTTTTNSKMRMSALLWVPVESLGENYLRAKSRLTLPPVDNSGWDPHAGPGKPFILYHEENGWMGLPRAYGHARLRNLPMEDERIDERGSLPMTFQGELWPKQVRPAQEMREKLEQGSNGGIFQAPCGSGKTTVAMNLIAHFSAPTMILLHNTILEPQWVEAAKTFLGLRDYEIGRVQRDRCDFVGKKIVIAVVQSLASRKFSYPTGLFTWPTVVIYDEVHKAAAPSFSWWMSSVKAKYRIGLSATPERSDNRQDVFHWHIGEILAIGERDEDTPSVYRYMLPDWVCPAIRRKNGKMIDSMMISRMTGVKSICKQCGGSMRSGRCITCRGKLTVTIAAPNKGSIRRQQIIAAELVLAVRSGRKILVLSDRIEALRDLEKRLRSFDVDSISYVIGDVRGRELVDAKKAQILLATYAKAEEGFDLAALDTLALLTPRANVEQPVGRIVRPRKLCPGKKEPFVLDFCDPAFSKKQESRMEWYEERGYSVYDVDRSKS